MLWSYLQIAKQLVVSNIMFLDTIHHLCLKHHPVYFSKYVSETGFCLRLQEEPTQLGPIDRASPYLQFPKKCVLKNEQDGVLDKDDG
jgi:hypothetical protein